MSLKILDEFEKKLTDEISKEKLDAPVLQVVKDIFSWLRDHKIVAGIIAYLMYRKYGE